MRSAEFDREIVLRNAIEVFIVKGYTKTSMQDLKAATGLHPGSIYCAFGSKKGLMLAAIEQYDKDKQAEFVALFEGKEKLLDGILDYLQCMIADVAACGQGLKACLTQKALSEVVDNEPDIADAIRKSMQQWQQGFETVFADAMAAGEIDDSRTPEQRTQSLVMGIFGLRTYAQTQPDTQVLNSLARQLLSDVSR